MKTFLHKTAKETRMSLEDQAEGNNQTNRVSQEPESPFPKAVILLYQMTWKQTQTKNQRSGPREHPECADSPISQLGAQMCLRTPRKSAVQLGLKPGLRKSSSQSHTGSSSLLAKMGVSPNHHSTFCPSECAFARYLR